MFFDGQKREDVIEYQETFLNKMKSLLPYFVEFYKDDTIVIKEYSNDCAVGKPNWRPIIMIIYDENKFFANNRRKKYGLLIVKVFCGLKKKKKKLWYQISYFHGQGSTCYLYPFNNKKT